MRREVPIALVYQAQGLHEHLEQALTDLGARVVYHAVAASFDRSALAASGAQVVVINLDPEVEEEFSAFDALLEDDRLHVVFNDAEVSSRLQGYDQARWARHLAAKILGRGELNPPRPPGAEAVPVRIQPKAPEYEGSTTPDLRFQLEGGELAAALAADTDESVRRTRAALVTAEEPVAAERVDPFTGNPTSRHDAPTVVLRSADLDAARAQSPSRNDAPTLELDADALQAPSRHDAPTVRLRVDDVRAAVAAEPSAIADDFLPEAAPAASDAADPFADLDGLSLEELPADDQAAPPPTPAPAGDPGFDLDPEFAQSLRDVGLLGDSPGGRGADNVAADITADVDVDAGTAAEPMAFTDEFGEALGALSLAPLDEDDAPSQKETPVAGLDDLLLDLPDAADAAPPITKAVTIAPPAKAAPAKGAPTKAAPPPSKPLPSIAHLSLADDADDKPAAAPAAPPPAPASRRSLDDFDFSGLSLAPLGDEEDASSPVTGRAQFQIDEKDRRAALPPAPAEQAAAPVASDASSEEALEFDLRGLRTPEVDPSIAAELAAMVAAAEALPLGKPVVHGVRNVWVLGASIGGPEAVREFLAGVPADVPALFLLAQHMGADFLDLMVQQLARATTLPVRTVVDGDIARHGEVIVVPLVERLQVDDAGRIRVANDTENSPYSPSIDRVMRDVADQFGRSAGAIVFSGMASDAIDGSVYLREHGGTVWVQDPGTCVISSMVDGAQDAGVVSFVGSPAELAREFVAEMSRRASG
jgi:two-component system chemotaxis response regulator CheB/chemosensory pili system protein ChpB (putative protein-glutamate methylesterase)